MNNKLKEHKYICDMLHHMYEQKNCDYGDSFGESFQEFGAIAPIVRIDDKVRRLKRLLIHSLDQKVHDESEIDTCMDLANYSIMLAIELQQEAKHPLDSALDGDKR